MLATYSSAKRKSVIFRVFKVTHTFKKREIFNFKKSQKKRFSQRISKKHFRRLDFLFQGVKSPYSKSPNLAME